MYIYIYIYVYVYVYIYIHIHINIYIYIYIYIYLSIFVCVYKYIYKIYIKSISSFVRIKQNKINEILQRLQTCCIDFLFHLFALLLCLLFV